MLSSAVESTEIVSEEISASSAPPQPDAEVRAAAREFTNEELENEIAVLLFAASEPLSMGRLASLLGLPTAARLDGPEGALAGLARRLHAAHLPIELRAIAGGWQLFTAEAYAETVAALSKARREDKISPAGLETLAVVAYRQPVTKAEIESIRGVQAGPILRMLVDRGLIKIEGRSDVPGHPLLYATSKKFLEVFGLASLEELPRDGELLKD